jgi:hypothetical protein
MKGIPPTKKFVSDLATAVGLVVVGFAQFEFSLNNAMEIIYEYAGGRETIQPELTVGSAARISPGTATPILRAIHAALSTGAPSVAATLCCDGVRALARIDQRRVGAHPIGAGMPVSSKGLGMWRILF